MPQICSREFCPLEFDAAAIDAQIKRNAAEFGFKFSASMEFCVSCKLCGATKYWERYADGTIRLRQVERN